MNRPASLPATPPLMFAVGDRVRMPSRNEPGVVLAVCCELGAVHYFVRYTTEGWWSHGSLRADPSNCVALPTAPGDCALVVDTAASSERRACVPKLTIDEAFHRIGVLREAGYLLAQLGGVSASNAGQLEAAMHEVLRDCGFAICGT